MALNRAQLLSGNSLTGGPVLSGEPQGVIAGSGVSISPAGVISLDASTLTTVVKTNNTSAFNNYFWPGSDGAAGTVLSTDGAGNLSWVASSGALAWTTKGQLVVGTGVNTSVFLNAGTDTAALVADSGSTSGLNYTSVIKTALLVPVGNDTTDRPATPAVGQVRYNNVSNAFEGYSGSPAAWKPLGGVPTGGGNDKIFYNNGQVVTTNYTIPTGENSMTAGSVTVNAGVTVTIPAGSSWAIV